MKVELASPSAVPDGVDRLCLAQAARHQALETRWQPCAGMAYFHIRFKWPEDAGQLDSSHTGTGGL